MNENIVQAVAGALVFAAVWIIISLLFASEISWVGGVVGAVAWFAAWSVAGQVRRRE